MRKSQEFAMQAAKEITIAALQSNQHQPSQSTGSNTAKYFEEVYTKILELAGNDQTDN